MSDGDKSYKEEYSREREPQSEVDVIYTEWLGRTSAVKEHLVGPRGGEAVTCRHTEEHTRRGEEQDQGPGVECM